MNLVAGLSLVLLACYAADRGVKLGLIQSFFAYPPPVPPQEWPSVSLIQPVTRGATHLAEHLAARAMLDYPGPIQHVVICDAEDVVSQAACRIALPSVRPILISPDLPGVPVASKIAKMTAGLEQATGSIACFVDDDILLPPDALRVLVSHLSLPGAGAAFGLACQSSWNTLAEALMSGFVNSNALTGYVPLALLTEPYTITGHLFALRRDVWDAAGGLTDLQGRFDDDHEIARRVRRRLGLRCVQTPLLYRVENALPSLHANHLQMRRWFVLPRQAMLPHLTRREHALSGLLAVGNLLPCALLALALLYPTVPTFAAIALAFLLFVLSFAFCERHYLPAPMPARWRWLLPILCFLSPLHVLIALLLPGDRIVWRGQAYRARKGGALERDE